MHACMHVCVYVCMYVCMYGYGCMHVFMYVGMYACTYVTTAFQCSAAFHMEIRICLSASCAWEVCQVFHLRLKSTLVSTRKKPESIRQSGRFPCSPARMPATHLATTTCAIAIIFIIRTSNTVSACLKHHDGSQSSGEHGKRYGEVTTCDLDKTKLGARREICSGHHNQTLDKMVYPIPYFRL